MMHRKKNTAIVIFIFDPLKLGVEEGQLVLGNCRILLPVWMKPFFAGNNSGILKRVAV
jgi:hypothetical protein